MRILYVITRAEYGGAQAHLQLLLESAVQRGHVAAVVVGEDGPLSRSARAMGIKVYIARNLVQPIRPDKDVRALADIMHVIRAFHPDIVHLHSSKAGIIGRLAGRLAGVPRVFTAHGWAFSNGVPRARRAMALALERLASRWADRIITVSEYDRTLAIRNRVARADQLVTIHNGVPDTLYRAEPARPGPVIITMVARFAAQKDYHSLVAAAAGLKGEFRLQLIGDGPDVGAVRAQVKAAGLSGRTDFLGARDDVDQLLSKAHVFVLSSRWEGFPISIVEAMRAGLPVVASDVGGVREAVTEGKTGFLVPVGDVTCLRTRLQELLSDRQLRGTLGSAGRARYEQSFTVDRMLDATWRVYTQLGGSPGRFATPDS